MKLHRKLGKTIPDVELPLNNSTTTNPQEEKLVPVDNSMKLIGEEYIEITFDETRKPIVFHCKLCDCKFNDANAKDAHLKGKRHRLSYRVMRKRFSFFFFSSFLFSKRKKSIQISKLIKIHRHQNDYPVQNLEQMTSFRRLTRHPTKSMTKLDT